MTYPVGLSNAEDAKAALFDRLSAEADGGLLAGVSVDYAYNGHAGTESIYGGGTRSEQDDAVEEHGVLMYEVTSVSLYIAVIRRPPVDVRITDQRAKDIAKVIARILFNDPKLAGGFTWLGVRTTQGDYQQTDDETKTIKAYAMQIGSYLVWGP